MSTPIPASTMQPEQISVINISPRGRNRPITIRTLIVQAWRERWSDLQFSQTVQHFILNNEPQLDKAQSKLADFLIEQAFVSPIPCQLIVSYLKHCIYSELISFSRALQAICKYQENQLSSIQCFLEIFNHLILRMRCTSPTELSDMCTHLMTILDWSVDRVVTPVLRATGPDPAASEATPWVELLHPLTRMLTSLYERPYIRMALLLASHEKDDDYHALGEKLHKAAAALRERHPDMVLPTLLEKFSSVKSLAPGLEPAQPPAVSAHRMCVLHAHCLVNCEAALHTLTPPTHLARKLALLADFYDLPTSLLLGEVFSALYMGLYDSMGADSDLKWAGLTFLKMPMLLTHLLAPSTSAPSDVLEKALVHLLVTCGHAVSQVDAGQRADTLDLLTRQLVAARLLSEPACARVSSKRRELLPPTEYDTGPPTKTSYTLIVQAAGAIGSIVKEKLGTGLSAGNFQEIVKIVQNIAGLGSREVILSSAAAIGLLPALAASLHQLTLSTAEGLGPELPRDSEPMLLLHDLTFLMLAFTVHSFGKLVLPDHRGNTGISRWFAYTFPSSGVANVPRPPTTSASSGDLAASYEADPIVPQPRLSALAKCFLQLRDITTVGFPEEHKVDRLCEEVPGAVRVLLMSWKEGRLSFEKLQEVVQGVSKSSVQTVPLIFGTTLLVEAAHGDSNFRPALLGLAELLTATGTSLADDDRTLLRATVMKDMYEQQRRSRRRTTNTQSTLAIMQAAQRSGKLELAQAEALARCVRQEGLPGVVNSVLARLQWHAADLSLASAIGFSVLMSASTDLTKVCECLVKEVSKQCAGGAGLQLPPGAQVGVQQPGGPPPPGVPVLGQQATYLATLILLCYRAATEVPDPPPAPSMEVDEASCRRQHTSPQLRRAIESLSRSLRAGLPGGHLSPLEHFLSAYVSVASRRKETKWLLDYFDHATLEQVMRVDPNNPSLLALVPVLCDVTSAEGRHLARNLLAENWRAVSQQM